MILTGHQPVYLPWAGLFHKIALADEFVFMDDVQYLKKDWNNRNRIKGPHGEIWLTVPVKKCPTGTNLKDVEIFNHPKEKQNWAVQHWKSIQSSYSKTSFFKEYMDFFEEMYLQRKWESLSELCLYQLRYFLKRLNINVKIHIQSELGYKGAKSDLILDMCLKHKATVNVFGSLGRDYVKRENFERNGIGIYFQSFHPPSYEQRFPPYVPGLSIIDLLFNCGPYGLEIIKKENITREKLLELV